jgi:hypothetical protein
VSSDRLTAINRAAGDVTRPVKETCKRMGVVKRGRREGLGRCKWAGDKRYNLHCAVNYCSDVAVYCACDCCGNWSSYVGRLDRKVASKVFGSTRERVTGFWHSDPEVSKDRSSSFKDFNHQNTTFDFT